LADTSCTTKPSEENGASENDEELNITDLLN